MKLLNLHDSMVFQKTEQPGCYRRKKCRQPLFKLFDKLQFQLLSPTYRFYSLSPGYDNFMPKDMQPALFTLVPSLTEEQR